MSILTVPASKAEAPSAADPREVKVSRQDLAAPAADAVGVLDPGHGGFPASLWDGTSAAVVRALLPRLPAGIESPTVAGLERKLLLSAGAAPKGAAESERPSLVELRVARLMALGLPDDAAKLAESAPSAVNSPGLARLKVEALLLAGRTDAACSALGGAAPDAEMSKIQVLCQLAGGNTGAGTLGLDLLREQKPADAPFIVAAEVLSGLPLAKGALVSLKDPSPVQWATLQAAKLPLPADAVDNARPAMLRTIALAATVAPEIRLAAAERAEALGLIDADALRAQVAAMPFKPEELAAPLGRPDLLAGPRGLALLARAAEAAADPAVKAPLLAKALDLAAARGRYATAARLLSPDLLSLPVQPPFAGIAPITARALLAMGRPDAAVPWLDLAQHDPENAKALTRLWPLARLWGVGDPLPGALDAWRQTVDARHALVTFQLFSALGLPVPDGHLAGLLDVARGAGAPAPALERLLAEAAHDNRLGGTVLAALAEIGPIDQLDPGAAAQVVGGLKAVGLEAEARRLAVEILLAHGG
jgi:hypothetical protein